MKILENLLTLRILIWNSAGLNLIVMLGLKPVNRMSDILNGIFQLASAT